jgi:N-carbamoylputrescine amidase
MKVCISEFPDDTTRQAAAWEALAGHVATARPELIVLPEMPFCEWIFVGDAVEPARWNQALDQHDRMIERLSELGAPWVVSSRPVDYLGRRFNEAFLWSAGIGYRALRRKWYLPDAPRARETLWFDQGDRDFTLVPCGPLRFGVQMCSEMMFPEHSRALGLAGAHLVVQPRATGSGKKWNVASEMGAISSGSYVISANRRSYARDWFCGNSWLLSPEATVLAETTAEQPFVTADIDLALAEKSKSTYPRDLQRMYAASGS